MCTPIYNLALRVTETGRSPVKPVRDTLTKGILSQKEVGGEGDVCILYLTLVGFPTYELLSLNSIPQVRGAHLGSACSPHHEEVVTSSMTQYF